MRRDSGLASCEDETNNRSDGEDGFDGKDEIALRLPHVVVAGNIGFIETEGGNGDNHDESQGEDVEEPALSRLDLDGVGAFSVARHGSNHLEPSGKFELGGDKESHAGGREDCVDGLNMGSRYIHSDRFAWVSGTGCRD